MSSAGLRMRSRISIHAAREGGDKYLVNFWHCPGISIHAAREGGDLLEAFGGHVRLDFNPRRP